MKKILAAGLVCAMALTVTVHVKAEEIPATCHISGCPLGECFMDTDCDGICGNHYFVDTDGNGICDYHCYLDVNADGICDYFIDADEDGICDHCHDHGKPVQPSPSIQPAPDNDTTYYYGGHHGRHHGYRGGRHHRCN